MEAFCHMASPSRSKARRAPAKGSLKPRNPAARSPLLRKGGVHQKSQGALRKVANDRLRKTIRRKDEA
jgi:hypothetical protein